MTSDLIASFFCGAVATVLGGTITATVLLQRFRARSARQTPSAAPTDLTAYTVPED